MKTVFGLTTLMFISLVGGSVLFAENKPSQPPAQPLDVTTADPASLLGLTPEGAYRLLGPPAEIFPIKASEDLWQVVHYYPSFQYLFWYNNHVWQVRLDKRFSQEFLGLKMGIARNEVETKLGNPMGKGDDWSVWSLPYKSFPRRIRLVFENGLLSDAYFFRSDF